MTYQWPFPPGCPPVPTNSTCSKLKRLSSLQNKLLSSITMSQLCTITSLSLMAEDFQHYHLCDKISFAIYFTSFYLSSSSPFLLCSDSYIFHLECCNHSCHLAFLLDYFNSFFTTKHKYFVSKTNLIMQFGFQRLYLKGQHLS